MAGEKRAVSLKVMAEAKQDGVGKVTSFSVDPRIVKVEPGFNRPISREHIEAIKCTLRRGGVLDGSQRYAPSTDPTLGWDIFVGLKPTKFYFWKHTSHWVCDSHGPHLWQCGPAPLVAAMRCKVASVYGDSIPMEIDL